MLKIATIPTTTLGGGLTRIVRSARDLPVPDLREIVRRADIVGRLDTTLAAASAGVRGTIQMLPGLRHQSRRRPLVAVGLLAGVLITVGLAGRLILRRKPAASAGRLVEDRDIEQATFDQAALDRAAGEGMPLMTVPDEARSDPNGEVRELTAIGYLS